LPPLLQPPGSRILLIDGNHIIGIWLTLWFTENDINVRLINDHFEDLLDTANPVWAGVDVLMCDLYLDGSITGNEILEFAKKSFPSIKRVLVTGGKGPDRDAALLNANALVVKPSEPDVFLKAVTA